MTADTSPANSGTEQTLGHIPLNSLTPVFPEEASPGDLLLIAGSWWIKLENNEGDTPIGYIFTGPDAGKVRSMDGGLALKVSHAHGWQITGSPLLFINPGQVPALSVTEAGIVLHGFLWRHPELKVSFFLTGKEVQRIPRHMHIFTEFSVWLTGPDGLPWGNAPLFTCKPKAD